MTSLNSDTHESQCFNRKIGHRVQIQEVYVCYSVVYRPCILLINDESIPVRTHSNRLDQRRSYLLGVLQQIDTEPRTRWYINEAVLRQRDVVDDVAPEMGGGGFKNALLEPGRILLDGKVRDGCSNLETRRKADRGKRVVRHDLDVVRLGQGGDFFRTGDPAAEGDVDAHEFERVAGKKRLELVYRAESLARADGDRDSIRNPGHGVGALRADGILDEHGAGIGDAIAEGDCLGGGQAAVELDEQIDLVAHDGADLSHVLDGILHLLDVRLEVDLVVALVEEGVDVAKRREPEVFLPLAFFEHLFDRLLVDVAVDAGFGPTCAPEQLVDGHAKRLALDVPESDVDGRDGGVDGLALEVAEPVHHVPVVLDVEGPLADQILGEAFDGSAGGGDVAPVACLAITDDALVGLDAGEHELPDVEGLDGFDDVRCHGLTS